MRILVSAMSCSDAGLSESAVAANWVRQIARRNDVGLVTADPGPPRIENLTVHHVSSLNPLIDRLPQPFVTAVKPDYFVFDRRAGRQLRAEAERADVFHHVTPQAPRYPSSLGRRARRFVLGPVGGGLRVPAAFRAAVEGSEPVFARLRNLDRLRFSIDPWLRATYAAADLILLTAPYMLDIVPSEYHDKTDFLAETAISPDEYRDESARRPDRDVARILYVGRITPYKGLEFMLRALARLQREGRVDYIADVVGAGESRYVEHCRRLAAQFGIEARTRFHGRCERAQVREFYRQADIFCFPTLAETTGNVILEAMAMGLPVVSTNYGGPAAVIDSESGILVDPDNPDGFAAGLAAALAGLCGDPERRRRIGAGARSRVLAEFTWPRKGELIQAHYEALAD